MGISRSDDSANELAYARQLEKAGYQLRIREPGWYELRLFKDAKNDLNLHVFSADCPEVRALKDRPCAIRESGFPPV